MGRGCHWIKHILQVRLVFRSRGENKWHQRKVIAPETVWFFVVILDRAINVTCFVGMSDDLLLSFFVTQLGQLMFTNATFDWIALAWGCLLWEQLYFIGCILITYLSPDLFISSSGDKLVQLASALLQTPPTPQKLAFVLKDDQFM